MYQERKVYVRAPYAPECLEELKSLFGKVVYEPWTDSGERYYEDEMLAHLKQEKPDIFITELDRITEKVLTGYDGLALIGDCRAIPANIDVAACTAHGVPLLCTPGRNRQAVAEMVVGLIITYLRQVFPSNAWMKEGGWVKGTTPYYLFMGHELQGMTVGVVGFGAVGRIVARLLDAFECNILFYDPFIGEDQGSFRKADLEEIFASCDVITLHAPVTKETEGMVNEQLLRSMKKEALFVNAARSALVDNDALFRLLEEKAIAGAILDVFDEEPPAEADMRFTRLDNVLVTPHICGSSFEVTRHQSEILNASLRIFAEGGDLSKVVYNKELYR